MAKFKTALLANWGLGAETIRCLDRHPGIELVWIVTNWDQNPQDPWRNAVYDTATKLGLWVEHQESLSFPDLKRLVVKHRVDLLFVHAYPKRLSELVFRSPLKGAINIHASLLPKYRGPAPADWVLKNRETRTGLTTHFIDPDWDTGDIIHQVEIPVLPKDNRSSLVERQKTVVNELLMVTIQKLETPGFKPVKQNEELASWAPRI